MSIPYSTTGLNNGDFVQAPSDVSVAIHNDDNPLVGWSFVQSVGTGTIAAWWIADATLGSGGYVSFVGTAATAGHIAYLEQTVPVIGTSSASASHVAHFSLFSAKHANVTQTLESRFVDIDGTVTGADSSTGTASTPNAPAPAVPNTDGTVPALARGNRVRIAVEVATGTNTGTLCTFTRAYITPGDVALYATLGAAISSFIDLPEITAPATPATGHVRIYAKSDGRIYSKDDAGVESGPL